MKPYKAKESYDQIASQFGVKVEDVQIINGFYWKTMRHHLTELQNPTINIWGLGTMKIKPWKVIPKINELSIKKEKWSSISTGSPIFESYATDLDKVINLKVMMDKEQEHRKVIKTKRLTYDA